MKKLRKVIKTKITSKQHSNKKKHAIDVEKCKMKKEKKT